MKVKISKEAVAITEYSCINEGEVAVNKCYFDLPVEFDGLTVTAAFNNVPVPVKDGWCVIPKLKKGAATIGVYAYSENAGIVELMYSPKPTVFFVNAGSYTGECAVEEIPGITEYERFCTMFTSEVLRCIEGTLQIKKETMPRIWELPYGICFVSEGFVFSSSEAPEESSVSLKNGIVFILPCDTENNISFRAFGDNGAIYTGICHVDKSSVVDEYGNSSEATSAYCDDLRMLPVIVSTAIDETADDLSYPTTKAVYDYCESLYEKLAGELSAVSELVGGAG